MKTGAEKMTKRWFLLRLIALLLLSSGCSLGLPAAEVAAPTFSGPPQIRIASPLPDQTFLAGATVIVQARIENAGPDLASISILLDGAVLGARQDPNTSGAAVIPVTMDWPTSSPGQFEIAVEAARANGELARETVSISVIAQAITEFTPGPVEDEASVPQPAQITGENADDAQLASATPFVPRPAVAQATDLPTADASSRIGQATVQAVITVPSNLRAGPGTEFELVGSIAVGEEVEIVSVNSARDWYHIRYGDLGIAWIYSQLLSPAGDVSVLSVETGPAQPTSLPETSLQESRINLVIEDIILQPDPLVCNETGTVSAVIHNIGTEGTASGAWVELTMIHDGTGNNSLRDAIVPHQFPPVPAGAFVTSIAASISSNVYFDDVHRITAAILSEGFFVETDLTDNSAFRTFRLARGNC